MANTRNGYPVKKTRSSLVRRPGPHSYSSEGGYRYFANNDVADILADAMWQWHTRIGLVRLWGGWRSPSFNDEVNGNVSSNHMSATATDTNWDKHPYERNFPKGGYRHGFTAAQLKTLRNILALYRDDTGRSIVRSGMDYAPGWVDAMHLETGMYTTNSRGGWSLPPRSKVSQVAKKVRARHRPPRTFDEIKAYQRKVGVTADGKHGPGTIAAIKRYQKARNVSQTGLWDEATKKSKLPAPKPAPKPPTPPKKDELMSDAQYKALTKLITDRTTVNVSESTGKLLHTGHRGARPLGWLVGVLANRIGRIDGWVNDMRADVEALTEAVKEIGAAQGMARSQIDKIVEDKRTSARAAMQVPVGDEDET